MISITTIYRLVNNLHAAAPRLLHTGYAFPPLRVGCVLSHRCNLRCSMCFVWKHGLDPRGNTELSTLEWIRIFRQIPPYAIITFTGGEPLLRPDIHQLLENACRGHRVHLVSNGTLFSEDLVRFCVRHASRSIWGRGLLSVGVSLEGPPEVHDAMVKVPGAYEKTVGTLKRFVAEKRRRGSRFPLLDLKIVICKDTAGSLVKLYELADAIGLDIISYQQCSTQESSYGIERPSGDVFNTFPPPVEPIPRKELVAELNALIRRAEKGRTKLRFNPEMDVTTFADRYENRFPLEQFTCSAAWSVMHIGPFGTVYPCFSIPMGNLREKSLMEIWNGKPYRAFRKKLREKTIFPGCVGCCVMKKRGKILA